MKIHNSLILLFWLKYTGIMLRGFFAKQKLQCSLAMFLVFLNERQLYNVFNQIWYTNDQIALYN